MLNLSHCVSEDTAYVIPRFPMVFGEVTAVRYWVETKPTYGQRLMTQYWDKADSKWFKAKSSGYLPIIILQAYTEADDYFKAGLISVVKIVDLPDMEHWVLFDLIEQYRNVLTPYQLEYMQNWYAEKKAMFP